ncbi:MAG: hypothetical protein ABJN84_00475 [Flavobacteriaceae bacterium]
MNNRIKQNREQRPSKRAKFKENNRNGIYSTEQKADKLNFKNISIKDLNKLKHQIHERAKKDQKKELALYGIFFVFGLIILIGMLVLLN